jgi:hypothetical protein
MQDLQTITTALSTLETSIKTLFDAVEELKTQQVTVSTTDELAPFSAFLMVELTPYFGGKGAKYIVDRLNRCRLIKDYRFFIPAYKLVEDDLEKRQLLKTVSAVYRYKFGGFRNPEKYSLRSEIKYAKACPHCGKLAQVLVNRLIAEGLWK